MTSGCINENLREEGPQPSISNVDVMSVPVDEGFELKVTVYVQNLKDSDTDSLSLKVKTKNPSTNLITAEHVENIGYLKSQTHSYKSMTFAVPESGAQVIETELFENEIIKDSHSTQVDLVEEITTPVPNVLLTDLVIETKKATNYGKDIIVDISPGILNQGEEVDKMILVITAISGPYTRYTGSTILSNVESGQRTRGSLQMTVPADEEYQFKIEVEANGNVLTSAQSGALIKLHDLKIDTPETYALIESGTPIEEPTEDSEEEQPAPGFGFVVTLVSTILALGFFKRKNKN
ncbi:hypothetical protein V7O62_01470 [Methanolobus sp. ZRKC2]|uniref:DUF7490 domain-containing protein n=1 Tax=Methanolobus sp. ZRKC2 TaxID=3125783 RepID=UPI0032554825